MAKEKSRWGPGPVAGRVAFGRAGFKAAMRRTWRDWTTPHTVASISRNPATGTVKARGVRRDPVGGWVRQRARRARTYRNG